MPCLSMPRAFGADIHRSSPHASAMVGNTMTCACAARCSIAVDGSDSFLAAVTAEAGETATSAVRVYEIGRHPALVR